jgi:hypothetical protein
MEDLVLSESFHSFLDEALQLGLSAAGSGRGAFHPVLLLESASGERTSVILYVDAEQPPDLVIPAACATLREKPNLSRYAVVSSLDVKIDGRQAEAIGIEAAERGMEKGILTVAPFKRGFLSKKVANTGEPIVSNRPPNHLS